MDWRLEEGRPIYAQLVEKIQMQIASGQYAPGDKLPSVRDLAAEAAVNPNTVQKAFAELERIGLIVTQRTNGRTVTEDGDCISEMRRGLAESHVREFFDRMDSLGYSARQIREILERHMQGCDPQGGTPEEPGEGKEGET